MAKKRPVDSVFRHGMFQKVPSTALLHRRAYKHRSYVMRHFFGIAVALPLFVVPAHAQGPPKSGIEQVDTAVILATDNSSSINEAKRKFIMDGYRAALTNPL